MPRFRNENGVDIQLTPEEETARDAEEATAEEERPAREMAQLRTKRNAKLVDSDWTQYNDSPLTDEVKAEWAVHREALRDLPANTDDPANPTWPTPPG
jgi:uncharacterized surface protein with fasciclin (FAS1) repeats